MCVRFLRISSKTSFSVSALLLTVLLSMGGFARGASAQDALSSSGAWFAYTYYEDGKLTCYMYSQPIKQKGNYKKRGDPHIMVTRRRGSEVVEEVSVTSGYPYKETTKIKVVLKIDGSDIQFGIIRDEHAWADDANEDKAVVKAMKRGNKLTVRGTSRKDTYSLDTYSLKGFTKTHKAIVRACP